MSEDLVVGQAALAFQSNLYESANPTRRWLHRRRHDWVVAKLQKWSPGPGATGFDCGVGCGVYTMAMKRLGFRVVAIDVNPSFVNAARDLGGVIAHVADICKPMDFAPKPFAHVAVCSEVLEHVEDPDAAIQGLRRMLVPGGVLVLTTPQKWSTAELVARLLKVKAFERLARAVYKEPVQELGHVSLMTSQELRGKLERSGFKIVEHEVFSFYLPVVAEFGGELGKRILELGERMLSAVPGLRWLVWTQGYVLRKI